LQGVDLRAGFQLRMAPVPAFVGAALLGCGLAPIIIELILVSRQVGLTLISEQQLAEYSHQIKEVINTWRTLSPVAILVALAVVPAVSEELFFRGYLLGALRGRLPGWAAIVATGILFGLFHASLGGVIMLDRVLPSSLLGIVLGWVCWQARSAWPGMLLHLLNNSLLLSLAYWEDRVTGLGLNASGESHVPLLWLAGAAVLTAAGLVMVYSGRSRYCSKATIAEPLLESSVTEGSHASERIPG
jgi:sodium transport system permease protein